MPVSVKSKPTARWMYGVGCLALALSALSCQTRPEVVAPPGPQRQYVGKAVRVNDSEGLVILQFVVLPSEGEELNMYRGDQKTGRVRVARLIDRPYAAADRLEGYLMRGDRAYREAAE